jgi:UDP-N-acetylmuramyl pentapeptide phosphotransferase/UDP-N-acetylglucosamine-1-phosphate transferase
MGIGEAAVELRGRLMTLAALLLACFAIGAAGTWLARRYALRHALLDAPGERRAHTVPTPRGGGIGIVVAALLAGLFLLKQAWTDYTQMGAMFLLVGGALPGLALVATIGLLDDHRPIAPWLRLLVHTIAAAWLAWATWQLFGIAWLALLAFGLALVLTNIWNFMDGIDGIAATQAILVAGAVAFAGHDTWTTWALVLAAATMGFLPFNIPRARIFLGDVGSGALGFAIAALLIGRIGHASPIDAIAWSLPISAFVIDATLTLARRVIRRERWWEPHAQHAYQAWARRAGAHMPVTLAYAGWTLAAIALMRGLVGATPLVVLLSCVAWYTAGAVIWRLLQRPELQGKGNTAVKESTGQ